MVKSSVTSTSLAVLPGTMDGCGERGEKNDADDGGEEEATVVVVVATSTFELSFICE